MQRPISIVMYTRGTGSGHLARINAVYRGFRHAKLLVEFYACAYRSKYRSLLEPGIRRLAKGVLPDAIDVFICDWSADDFVSSLPEKRARLWVGLKRLGTIPNQFPGHFHIIAMEPDVHADATIWPILSTWPDEVLTRPAVRTLLNINDDRPVILLVENGAYAKHLELVFGHAASLEEHIFRCSNSPFADKLADLTYYPIARLFSGVEKLVLGGGYNSVHEAMSYADLGSTTFINVGGDDQAKRLRLSKTWEKGRGSRAHELALHVAELLRGRR